MKRINLIPEDSRKIHPTKWIMNELAHNRFFQGFGAVIIVIIGMHIFQSTELKNVNKKLKKTKKEYQKLVDENKIKTSQKDLLQKKVDQLQKMKQMVDDRKEILDWYMYSKIKWSDILKEISERIPGGIWCEEMTLGKKHFTIEGKARKNENVAEFMDKLDSSYLFEDTVFDFTKRVKGDDKLIAFGIKTQFRTITEQNAAKQQPTNK